MGRQVRRVSADWEHPKDANGHYKPLVKDSPKSRDEEWRQWDAGFVRGYRDGEPWKEKSELEESLTFEEYYGDYSDDDMMPDFDNPSHYQMYEDTTEGTPISPVFATPEELARWLADNGASAFASQTADYESWLRVCKGTDAPSAVYEPGKGLRSGVEKWGRIVESKPPASSTSPPSPTGGK